MLMAHQKQKIEQYTYQYDKWKICSWQGVAAPVKQRNSNEPCPAVPDFI
jgi:hypothetical protein